MGTTATSQRPVDPASRAAAALIVDAFEDYHERFADITRRARRCFERRDWRRAQADAVARINLYDAFIRETLSRLDALLDERVRSRSLWASMREAFLELSEPLPDRELYRTFFNSLSRRFFQTDGVDAKIEFLATERAAALADGEIGERVLFEPTGDLAVTMEQILDMPAFAARFADIQGDARALAEVLLARGVLSSAAVAPPIEMMRTVFYREQRAYLVGRLVKPPNVAPQPLVLALVHDSGGVRVDAVLTDVDEVSILFGYARSYFHADLPVIASAVAFLKQLLPHKPLDELYTVIGRAKQGKTERYRQLFEHLSTYPDERLVAADGVRGMVMAVFTPRHYPLVFKVIRDHFAYPKDSGRRQVEAKYRLVFLRDRVGRLVDAQDFRRLRFPRTQFEPALLEELLGECSGSVDLDGDDVVVRQCYVERRLRPLDLFVREAPPELARKAVLDYGQAIKDLALSGIFPGDLLLKNFGVSRNGRAVFYDFDELCTIGDCRFRAVPPVREEDETRPLDEWLYAAPGDVFPELFPRFLGLPAALRNELIAAHGEIFDPAWWQRLQAQLAAGGHIDVPPYPEAARLPYVD